MNLRTARSSFAIRAMIAAPPGFAARSATFARASLVSAASIKHSRVADDVVQDVAEIIGPAGQGLDAAPIALHGRVTTGPTLPDTVEGQILSALPQLADGRVYDAPWPGRNRERHC